MTSTSKIAYRIDEAAAMIGLGKSKMWELIAEGQIPARKIGSATVIRHVDLQTFVDAAPLTESVRPNRRQEGNRGA